MDTTNTNYYYMMRDEIDSIDNPEIRRFANTLLNRVPDYFFKVPASSSGKYHPKNDLGEGGLVRHSISVKRMLVHLLELDCYSFSDDEKDLLIVAALFHDCMKSGTQEEYKKNNRTKFLHPVLAANFIITTSVIDGFKYDWALYIADAVISHMGQWNTNKSEDGELPVPVNPAQRILHLADYLVSRKDINMVLREDDEIIDNEVIVTQDDNKDEPGDVPEHKENGEDTKTAPGTTMEMSD